MTKRRTIAAALVGVAASTGLTPAYAHGFGERYDLPMPLNFFLVGAAATVALSFMVIGLFLKSGTGHLRYPRYNLLAVKWLGTFLASRLVITAIKAISVALFGLILATSLFGSNKSPSNFSPTFVWIIWWVGMGYSAALLGNLWALVNPWKITYEWAQKLAGGRDGPGEDGIFRYPTSWDIWPGVVLFLVFAWVENVYQSAAVPFNLGLLVLAYSVVTWAGMLAFGKEQWLKRGEAFSILFGFFSRFSPTEVRVADAGYCATCRLDCVPEQDECVDCYGCFERAERGHREFNVRPYAVGLAGVRNVSAATGAFVVLALATVTFDGLSATGAWTDLNLALYDAASVFGPYAIEAVETLGLVGVPAVFLAVYLAFAWAIRWLSGDGASTTQVARAFVFALVPIALAYNMAHFISLLAITGQAIIPLASDPFGFGWDLIGTGGYVVNLRVVNAKFVWFLSVAAIVIGHIVSVYVAHVISLERTPDRAHALRGQYPMLVLMVFYTATSLWIIAQPIVNDG